MVLSILAGCRTRGVDEDVDLSTDRQGAGLPVVAPHAVSSPPAPRLVVHTPAAAPATVETNHTIRAGGEPFAIRATAGFIHLDDDNARPAARMFFTAYARDYGKDARPVDRPLTFAFNGGPGASSIWLHFSLGPKRVRLAADGRSLPPPYELEDNDASWLEFTDLVLVDPVGTGFSHPEPGARASQFYGMSRDVQCMAQFIREFVTRYDRWVSPLFVAGESYGALRTIGVTAELQQAFGIDLSGIVLLSCPLDFRTLMFAEGDDLSYPLFLPSYCATALYHRKLAPELLAAPDETLASAESWALGGYWEALAQGDALSDAAFNAAVARMAELTGLSESFVRRSRLRVTNRAFIDELLCDEGASLGWEDGRFTRSGVSDIPLGDPAYLETTGPYVATWQRYIKDYLGFTPGPAADYEHMSVKINAAWDWEQPAISLVNVYTPLRETVSRNRHLRVMVAAGIYDLNTPYFATRYSLNHAGLRDASRERVEFHAYKSGHQIYIDRGCMQAFSRDAKAFYSRVLALRFGDDAAARGE